MVDHEAWKVQYSPLPPWTKFLWDYEKLRSPFPVTYEVDISNHCNGCVAGSNPWPEWCCSHKNGKKDPPINMDLDVFKGILEEAYLNNCGITLTGGGEPSCHPEYTTFLEYLHDAYEHNQLLGYGIVTNGKIFPQKQYENICKCISEYQSNIWIRVSLNDRNPSMPLLHLMEKYPKTIGISMVYTESTYIHCNVIKRILEPNAKFVRMIPVNPLTEFTAMNPLDCVGRKFVKIFNPKGEETFCCHSRETMTPPEKCPIDCRWGTVDLQDAWDCNPFT